jgi:hypothetical protein
MDSPAGQTKREMAASYEELERLRRKVDARQDVAADVEAIIRKAARRKQEIGGNGSVLNELMAAYGGGGETSTLLNFATFIKERYYRGYVDLREMATVHPCDLMCASTPTNKKVKCPYTYAVVAPPKSGKANIVRMIAEGLRAIDGMRHPVQCRHRWFDFVHCRFNDHAESGMGLADDSSIFFTNDYTTPIKKGDDVVGPNQRTNVSENPDAVRAMLHVPLFTKNYNMILADAITLDAVPDEATHVVFNVQKTMEILEALRSEKNQYPVIATKVDAPEHALFAVIRIEADGTIVCRLNDPNESSIQAFESMVSTHQEKAYASEARKAQELFLKPGEKDIKSDVQRFRYDLEKEKKVPEDKVDFYARLYEARIQEERSHRYVDEDGDFADEFYDESGRLLTEDDGLISYENAVEKLTDAPECYHDYNSPGGWCQTWSAFQLECALRKNTIHDDLIRIASSSKKVQVRPGYEVYATHDEDGKKLARLFAADPGKLHKVTTDDGKTMMEWGCALDALVRCLAVRYLDFIAETTSLKKKAAVFADGFELKAPSVHLIL